MTTLMDDTPIRVGRFSGEADKKYGIRKPVRDKEQDNSERNLVWIWDAERERDRAFGIERV